MRVVSLITACLLLQEISSLNLGNSKNINTASGALGRRNMLQQVAGSIAVGSMAGWVNPSQAMALESPKTEKEFQTYRVIPDASASLNPTIKSVQV
jgi:hypothetical protein